MRQLHETQHLTFSIQAADRQWLLDHAKGAQGILCMLNDKCDEELLKAAGSDLKVVSSYSAGCETPDAT